MHLLNLQRLPALNGLCQFLLPTGDDFDHSPFEAPDEVTGRGHTVAWDTRDEWVCCTVRR